MFPSRLFFSRRTDLFQLRIASIAVCAKKCNKNILQRLTSFMTSFSTSSSFLCSQRRSEVQRNSKNLARCWLNHTCPLGISVYSNHTTNAALRSAQVLTLISYHCRMFGIEVLQAMSSECFYSSPGSFLIIWNILDKS